MEAVPRNVQMVDSDGIFCKEEVRNFFRGLPNNENITVVSIIGPQSTGKSYLLNQLFGTDFSVLDPDENHGQTTKGIWIAQCSNNPSMVVIDVEGSDSSNRAEDGTSFDNQAALLAFTISNALLLNIPARALGQNHGACLPILQMIFKERISLLSGKLRVLVTVRDCQNLTNMRDIERANNIIEECWKSGPKTNGRLKGYIEVSVVQFPDATNESRSEEFKTKLDELREQFTPAGLSLPQLTPPYTAAMLLNNVQEIWANIKTNRKLNIPSFNVLLSKHRCEIIMQEELSLLDSEKKFSELKNMQGSTSPKLFKTKLDDFLRSTLNRFDASADGCIKSVDDFQAKLKKEIVIKLQDTFVEIVRTKKEEILEQEKISISRHLRMMKKGVISSIFMLNFDLKAFYSNVNRNVDRHVKMFDDLFPFEDFCEEYKEYKEYISIYRKELENALKDYAEQKKKEIEKNHRILVSFGKGALIASGLGATGYMIYICGAETLAAVLPSLLAMLNAASPKITSLFKCMVPNLIIPAAQDAVKEIIKSEKVTVKHVEKFMFNISMAMIVFILKNLSEQHSAKHI